MQCVDMIPEEIKNQLHEDLEWIEPDQWILPNE